MTIEELIFINVEDDEWLDVCNEVTNPMQFIDKEALLDYVAMQTDTPENDEVMEDLMCCDFDAKECIGMNAKDIINNYINEAVLRKYFEDTNKKYCQENNLCADCKCELIDEGDGMLICPNGCI